MHSFEADAVAERTHEQDQFRAEAEYKGYRFTSSVFHTSSLDRTGTGSDQHSTTVTVGSALAFADGHFGVSRPITDSFVIVSPHPSLRGYAVDVNPYSGRADAQSGLLGAAVLPDLTSYYRHQVLLAADLPEGLDLGRDFYLVQPHYRSGIAIQAGSAATILLEAVLVDQAGKPLGLELGRIKVQDHAELAPVDFFTNTDGRLRVAGAAPGRVKIELTNYPEAAVTVEIPQGKAGRYNAGTIRLSVAADSGRVGE